MSIVTRYMGLIFFWLSVKDLGGYAESEVSSTLEDVKGEYSALPQTYQHFISTWVETLDKFAKGGVNLPFVAAGEVFLTEAVEQELFPDLDEDLQTALSEIERLSNLSNAEIGTRLMDNVL